MSARPFMTFLSLAPASRAGRLAAAAIVATALAGPAQAQEAESLHAGRGRRDHAVTYWNSVADAAFAPSQGTNPMAQSRTFAVLHAAIHDALNAIKPRFEPYTPGLAAAPGASIDAAVASAARDVLLALLPGQAALVESAYADALAAVPDGAARAAGLATGQAAAQATLARRQGDGADEATQPAYVPRPGAGEYRFTPPFDFAALPGWGAVRPFVIDLDDHRLEGPLPVSSAKYARDLAYVRSIGEISSWITRGKP
jgi:hypothetical protein